MPTKKRREPNPTHYTSMHVTAADDRGVVHLMLVNGTAQHGHWVVITFATGCRPHAAQWRGKHPHPLLPALSHSDLSFVSYGDAAALVTCLTCQVMRP